MVAKKDFQLALGLLLPLVVEYEARGHMLTVASVRTLQASLEFRVGDAVAAVGSLRMALALATSYGLRRVLLEGGDEIIDLLSQMLSDTFLPDDQRQMASVCVAQSGDRQTSQAVNITSTLPQSPSEQIGLSAKELEIVELMAQAFSNKSIARALNISSGTVKWHLKNIFAKLGVGSREGAVIKARNLRLIG